VSSTRSPTPSKPQRRALAERLDTERRAAQEIEIAKQVQASCPQRSHRSKPSNILYSSPQSRCDYYDFLSLGPTASASSSATSPEKESPPLPDGQSASHLPSQCAMALNQPQRLLCSVNQLFCDTLPTAPSQPSSSPNMTTPEPLAYANAPSPRSSASQGCTVEHLEATATCGYFSRSGIARLEMPSSARLTPGPLHRRITESTIPREQFGEQRLSNSPAPPSFLFTSRASFHR